MKAVKLLRRHGSANAGEIVGLPDDRADLLIKAKAAVLVSADPSPDPGGSQTRDMRPARQPGGAITK